MAKTEKKKGTSLAKGPVGLIGLLLLAYGITALIFGGHSFTQHLPNGTVHGKTWIGLEVNGWSGLLFIAAGLLLLLGAPMHWGAKTMSLIVGIVLGAAALVALATTQRGVFGLLAANHLTELVWGAAGVMLILLSLMPRVGRKTEHHEDRDYDDSRETRHVSREPRRVEREPAPSTAHETPFRDDGAKSGGRVVAPSRASGENLDENAGR